MNNKKFIIINTKGGVGKSTTASQVIGPYLYDRTNQEVSVIEFDDCNKDNEVFIKSDIFKSTHVTVSDIDAMRLAISKFLIQKDKNIVIDVGGNKAAEYFLQIFESNLAKKNIDAWVIPIGDGEQDSVNGLTTYSAIREFDTATPVLFALSRVNLQRRLDHQFFQFLGVNDNNNPLSKYGHKMQKMVNKSDQNYITIADSDVITISRVFARTIYELADSDTDYESQLNEAIEKGDDDSAMATMWIHGKNTDMKIYRKNILEPAFDVIDGVLGIKKNSKNKSNLGKIIDQKKVQIKLDTQSCETEL